MTINASTILDRVKKIIVDHLGIDEKQLALEANFINDLGADSLGTVELIMAFEEEFDLDIPDEEAEEIRTVGDAVSYIQKHKMKREKVSEP